MTELCTILEGGHICGELATHVYRVSPTGKWWFLCFDHWGATAIARVIDKDAEYAKSCVRIEDWLPESDPGAET